MKEYKCKNCGERWRFFPKDFGYKKKLYPTRCPHCTIPIWDMIVDVTREEGFLEAMRILYLRIKGGGK